LKCVITTVGVGGEKKDTGLKPFTEESLRKEKIKKEGPSTRNLFLGDQGEEENEETETHHFFEGEKTHCLLPEGEKKGKGQWKGRLLLVYGKKRQGASFFLGKKKKRLKKKRGGGPLRGRGENW